MDRWTKVRLGDVLTHSTNTVIPHNELNYKLVTVKMHNKGVMLRREVIGSEIKSTRMFCVQNGQFILSRIDARNGAFGIIPSELDGALVTNDFPVFNIERSRIDLDFLKWMVRTHDFIDMCKRASEGTTNRVRLKEDKFLNLAVPLPPLPEQRRIVKGIEELTAKIEEARGLRRKAKEEAGALLSTELNTIFVRGKRSGWSETTLSSICEQPQYGYTESAIYEPVGPKFLRITDIQNGYVGWDAVPYCQCPRPEKYYLREGDILFARSGATTGKSYLVKGCPQSIFASYLIRVRVKSNIVPELLYWFFQSPLYWTQVMERKSGSAQPNMNGKKLSNLKVVFPEELEEQHRIVAYLDNLQIKTDDLKRLQHETQSELDALMPSILARAFMGEL